MISRRNILLGTCGVLAAKAPQPKTAVNFEVPANACDCHTHVFGSRFPLSPSRRYTTEDATPEEMAAMHHSLGVQRVVIVTPSVYGSDNSSTLFGLEARKGTARGIAVIGDQATDRDLLAMDRAGIRGIRLNLSTNGVSDPKAARRQFLSAVDGMKALGWHIQMFTNLAMIQSLKDLVADASVPIVFDHFGGSQASLGVRQGGLSDLVDLLKSGHAYVKVSAPYLSSTQSPGYFDLIPIARELIRANPDRILWGTDWPHPNATHGRPPGEITPFREIDDGLVFNQLAVWAPDPEIRKKILVDNPARLYRF